MSYNAISLVLILIACCYKSHLLVILLSITFSQMVEFIMQQNVFYESLKCMYGTQNSRAMREK
jgi:hypothetical protein